MEFMKDFDSIETVIQELNGIFEDVKGVISMCDSGNTVGFKNIPVHVEPSYIRDGVFSDIGCGHNGTCIQQFTVSEQSKTLKQRGTVTYSSQYCADRAISLLNGLNFGTGQQITVYKSKGSIHDTLKLILEESIQHTLDKISKREEDDEGFACGVCMSSLVPASGEPTEEEKTYTFKNCPHTFH